MPDHNPKKNVVMQKGGTKLTSHDNNTRTILAMDIGPKTISGSGSGSPKSTQQSIKSALNKKTGK